MDNILEITNLNFYYNSSLIFNNLNLCIKRGTFTTIIGENNYGKEILSKVLSGIIITDADIKYNHQNDGKSSAFYHYFDGRHSGTINLIP